jgi:hypothetical protein
MSHITIPVNLPQSKKESNDHPKPVFKINYLGSPPYGNYKNNCEQITLYYPHSISFQPYQTQTLHFPLLIETSLPCQTLVYGSHLLFRFGLTSNITITHSNDSFLSVTVYNYKDQQITFSKNCLTFICQTVIANI